MTIVLQNPKQTASELLHETVTFVPFSESLIAEGRSAYLELISLFAPYGTAAKFIRPGERDPDLGLLRRRGEAGSDYKDFFHYASDFSLHLDDHFFKIKCRALRPLFALKRLYDALNDMSVCVAGAIDEEYGNHFRSPLAAKVLAASRGSSAYNTTTLRGLRYPPLAVGGGAKPHIDRSLFSIHCGDEGGSLCVEAAEGQFLPVSIPPGEVALFRGIKLYVLSNGTFTPIMHGSVAEPDKERLAMVQFVQAETDGVSIFHAMEAYELLRWFKG